MDPLNSLCAETDEIRRDLGDRASFRDPEMLARLARRIEEMPGLCREPAVRAFLDDIRDFIPGRRLSAVKEHINTRRDNRLFSLFDASYFPSLRLEFLAYETLPTNPHMADRYASNTMPVNIVARSAGFGSRPVVALFPENHIDGVQEPDDQIFYFIDKFVERHRRITRRMLGPVLAEGSLPLVQKATDTEIELASSWWVRLHEYHHRQGDMPIPEFLPAKKSKPLAGLEELRVDVSGMLALLGDAALPAEPARLTYEYILAERLLRYAVEGIPRPNYDAVASQLLFSYLTEHGGLRLRGGLIHLDRDLPRVLAGFLGEIEAIERRIHQEPVAAVKKRLLEFTHAYTDYDAEAGDYRHIPYFAAVKASLGV
ncbi:hypothetical protein AA958_24680 [Streptomyces sp. CNQ-509]|uniref:DUF6421 family protein n=1 Tax=unclassified Streptomyces TaxID=2593676 RepID=UPI00062DCF76|nr:DUF6421 family protein [Streptomyces sp. CNQ-509]AKH84872.1 hypothetical protein AA958_24680 [Streptomyces sp. CNQ-509]